MRTDVWVAIIAAMAGTLFAVVGTALGVPPLTYLGASITGLVLGWLLLRAAILSALRQARSEE